MEFLGSLGEAEGLGITREEFLYIWNKEMDVKILCQQVRNLFSLTETQASGNTVNNSQEDDLKLSESLAQQANEIEELKSSLVELKSELCRLRSDLSQSQQILETTSASLKDQQEHGLQTVMTSIVAMRSDLDILRSDTATDLQSLSLKLDPIVNMKEKIETALKTLSNNHVKCSSTPLESLGVKSVMPHKIDEDKCDILQVENSTHRKVKDRFNEISNNDQRKISAKSNAKNTANNKQSCSNGEHASQISMLNDHILVSESRSNKSAFANQCNIDSDLRSINGVMINEVADNPNQNKPEKHDVPSGVLPSEYTATTMNSPNVEANMGLIVPSASSEKLGVPSSVPPSEYTAITMTFQIAPTKTGLTVPSASTEKHGEPSSAPPSDSTSLNINSQNAAANASLTVTSTSASTACFNSRIVRNNTKHANSTITKLRVDKKAEVKDTVGRSDQTETGEVQVLLQPRVHVMPAEGASFSIPSTHPFYDYKGDFYTELYYILGLPCKVRLRLRLAKHGRLAVTALLSLKENETSFKLPVYISGAGYISAQLSGGNGYSKLWEFPNCIVSSTHADDEISIEALVFLQTNRYCYKNITYKQLVEMGYDMNRNLKFKWNLKCSQIIKLEQI
ncbi:unnamed protein product [Lymnaea stagnalis]|uniref:MATH domain-containing protein n=1 Tax=Lymnaea stagnalis TaxID=6523 RepID=A0AAV2IJY4_LYMST